MPVIKPGVLIRHDSDLGQQNIGSLGCFVRKPGNNDWYILSAAHVIALNGYAAIGDTILYISPDGSETPIATLDKFVHYHSQPGALERCDAAIAKVQFSHLLTEEMLESGNIRDWTGGIYRGQQLHFTSSNVTGQKRPTLIDDIQVYDFHKPVAINYSYPNLSATYPIHFQHQILYGHVGINNTSVSPASNGGDSGSILLDEDNKAIGLHVGRTPDDGRQQASVCTPIKVVLDALEIELM